MSNGETTAAIQRYLLDLGQAGDPDSEPIVRDLIARSAHRLRALGGRMLHGAFPRLARPPANLHADDMLGALVERLMQALRQARPRDARQFFALANQHLRWELLDLARKLDAQPPSSELIDDIVAAPEAQAGAEAPTSATLRILEAIERLPEAERDAFSLVRIQDLTHEEAAGIAGVSTKTIQRRVARAVLLLSEDLADLPGAG